MANAQLPVPLQSGERSKNRGFSFRLALPCGQLVLCALILWPTRGYIFYELGLPEWTQGTPFLFRFGGPALASFAAWSQHNGMQMVAGIDLPAGVIQLPYAMFSTSHSDLRPTRVDFRVWRAITWPILGMVFWWIAGRGADALVAARRKKLAPRIRWTETIIGFLLAAGGAVFVIVFVFTAGPDRGDYDLQVVAAGAGMWAILGGLTVAARIVQRRMRRASMRESAVAA